MLGDWDVLVCAGLDPQSVSMAEEGMVMCHPAGCCHFKENGTGQEGKQAKLLF